MKASRNLLDFIREWTTNNEREGDEEIMLGFGRGGWICGYEVSSLEN